jgi:hypothetical protein
MSDLRFAAMVAGVAVLAALLVAGAPLAALTIKEDVSGKVTAYEKGKSITVESGGAQKTIKIGEKTVVEGDVAVGKTVKVTHEDGTATKISAAKD